ncbi:hypothetical protein NB709_001446 [Xanthomonas sacchari]|nr:hypothetical protein [Xanthomonas sacchari]MCW0411570.1 hypothetical protein [Xanthomonas sacchari]
MINIYQLISPSSNFISKIHIPYCMRKSVHYCKQQEISHQKKSPHLFIFESSFLMVELPPIQLLGVPMGELMKVLHLLPISFGTNNHFDVVTNQGQTSTCIKYL